MDEHELEVRHVPDVGKCRQVVTGEVQLHEVNAVG
jgi:hypothetical protein